MSRHRPIHPARSTLLMAAVAGTAMFVPYGAAPAAALPNPDPGPTGTALTATPDGSAQSDAEAVMIAAGQWVVERVDAGDVRLDPHRTGEGKDEDRVRRVAQALGADLATLEDTRICEDALDPSSCRLDDCTLLAIAAPSIDDGRARVKVYAWYPSDDVRSPVAHRTWDLRLERTGQGWRVTGNSG